jgi:hypothetical protein
VFALSTHPESSSSLANYNRKHVAQRAVVALHHARYAVTILVQIPKGLGQTIPQRRTLHAHNSSHFRPLMPRAEVQQFNGTQHNQLNMQEEFFVVLQMNFS